MLDVLTSDKAVFLYCLLASNFVCFYLLRKGWNFLLEPDAATKGLPRAVSVLSEKTSIAEVPPVSTGAAPAPSSQYDLSYSRVCGSVGMLIMASMLFGLGDYILWAAFFQKSLELLDKIGSFFLAGSALFAPYAFNQLSSAFQIKQN